MISNHEKEISLRLKFEAKLNNQTSIFKELESRFKTISKEFVVNNERQKELFELLANLRQENSSLSARNSELELENKVISEKFKVNEQIVEQMNFKKEN